jgi:hypothetical protein
VRPKRGSISRSLSANVPQLLNRLILITIQIDCLHMEPRFPACGCTAMSLPSKLLRKVPEPLTAPARLPIIAAHALTERHKPFDGAEWLFEMKYDGYRGLLYLEHERGRLISRNGRTRFGALAWR